MWATSSGEPAAPLAASAGRRAQEMVGQLRELALVVPVQGQQRLRDPQVRAGPFGDAETLVEHVADQRVGEGPAVDARGDAGHHASRLGLGEQAQHLGPVPSGRPREQLHAEPHAGHGRKLQQVAAVRVEPGQPPAEHRPDRVRHYRAGEVAAEASRPRAAQPALGGQ